VRPETRGVFAADEDAALAELEKAWADGSYHGFCVLEPSVWSVISSVGQVLTGTTPDGLDHKIRAYRQALQSGPAPSCCGTPGRCSR
jgi:hypothetical protein